MHTIKKIVLWDFNRASWQWDLLCILIVCFIFLTPKNWYEDNQPSVPIRTVKVSADKFSANTETLKTEVRTISGNPAAEILASRQIKDDLGQVFYEVDIK